MKDTLYAIGESLIDFIPNNVDCDFSEITSFSPKVGGAPANVLGAFSKLGGKTQLITQLGNDLFGNKILQELKLYNIGTNYVVQTNVASTALAFVSLKKDGNRDFSFYRNPSADMLYNKKEIKKNMFTNCFGLHFCSISLGNFPMKNAHKKAIKCVKKGNGIISFDPNIRLPLWNDHKLLKKTINKFLLFADIVKISDEEIEFITGTNDIEKGCKQLLKNCSIVLCTCGSKGTYGFTKDFQVLAPTTQVEAKDTTGAGDAFIGAFLYILYSNNINKEYLKYINEKQLLEYITIANNYATRSVLSEGAIPSYPNTL